MKKKLFQKVILKQQVASLGVGAQEKQMMAIMESCPTKCVFSGVGGNFIFHV